MNSIVFGAKGQLGRDLTAALARCGPVVGADLPGVDIAEPAQVRQALLDARADLAVNAAAYTDVEGAEDDHQAAWRVNETGAQVVAGEAQEVGAAVVYYSTDFVFDGTKRTPYTPADPVSPTGVYATSKAAGEAATRAANPDHLIIRTAWLYGPGGNNFVEKILSAAERHSELRVVEDEVGSPTHTWDLCEATKALCEVGARGTYHAVNGGACSRFEFAKEILRLAGSSSSVCPCAGSEYPSKAPRPAYSVLSTESLAADCGYVMRSWRAALEHYMKRREAVK